MKMSWTIVAYLFLLVPCMAFRSASTATEAANASGIVWKRCTTFSGTKYKRYYFQVDTADGMTVSILFIRNKVKPRLELYFNQSWSVAYFPDSQRIEWQAVPASDEVTPSVMTLELGPSPWMAYVENAFGGSFTFVTQDLKPYTFTGGVYFPEKLMLNALKKKGSPVDRDATDVRMAPAKGAAWQAVKNTAGATGRGLGVGTAAGAGVGAAGGFLASGLLITSAGVVAQATAIGAIGGGAVGLAAGAAVGLTVGLPVAVVKGAAQASKMKREMSLTMAKKLFEKMRCHPSFKQCAFKSRNTHIISVKTSQCPYKMDVEEALKKLAFSDRDADLDNLQSLDGMSWN